MSTVPGPSSLQLALTTEADAPRAEVLARAALEARLAACVALRPITALYRWQGAIERAEEVQILFKTDVGQLEALEQLVRRLHSYACPQWISWSARAGAAYGAWLVSELDPASSSAELSPGALSPDAGPPAP